MPPLVARASDAQLRIARARQWLAARAAGEEVLVVAPSADAAKDLLRRSVTELAASASFGWHRVTLGRLAASIAEPVLAERGLAPVGPLACEAVAARAVEVLRRGEGLGRHAEISEGPGFSRSLAATIAQLRLAKLGPQELSGVAPDLARLQRAFEHELEDAGLADGALIFALAEEAARVRDSGSELLGLPTLLFDLAPGNVSEARLLGELVARAPEWMGTQAAGDEASAKRLQDVMEFELEDLDTLPSPSSESSLRRLQRHLFEDTAPSAAALGDDVAVLSAPGEGRECVEVARRIRQLAAEGIPFDQIAVLLRSADEYRPHLEEALGRAGVPAHFSRGAVKADPAGRALLALLACARERLSARGFAEYLSLGELPDADPAGAPPDAPAARERWVPPDEEFVSERLAELLGEPLALEAEALAVDENGAPDERSVTAGNLRVPRAWEKLLVDASVIGGLERWERRLAGLEKQRVLDLGALDDADDPREARIRRDIAGLQSLRAFALPLLRELDGLPSQARWGEWLDALSALAARALRRSERVLAVLAELAPMAEVGPVGLDEVAGVLSRRLLSLSVPPQSVRYGKVFVGPAETARGLSFEAVLIPGLAEKLFPRKIAEDPMLLDSQRRALGRGLPTNEDRVANERLALRLAVGAARRRVVLSYPRLDLEQSRPRVPSFYLLEAMRAAEGRLPGFDELASRAETFASLRVGWPAPDRPEDAIDEAEHDLALLEKLRDVEPDQSVGAARYLLTSNPHLGRALRFRARRWLARWTPADGLVDPVPPARAALARHALQARSFSATALQNYAVCPYRFFLYAVLRLARREEPEAIEEMDPLQRGSLVHEVQFELFTRLSSEELLPVREGTLEAAQCCLDEVLDAVALRHRDELAPAIDRVWDDGVQAVRADLREWLRRASEDDSGFVPARFELSFGLPDRRESDPHSIPDPVALDCGIRLRGAIDLVEYDSDQARLRVTDHKTGKARIEEGEVISGGKSLQPVLYALAMEKLEPTLRVESGRLYYCTSAGGFEEREVPLDQRARNSAEELAQAIGHGIDEAFLPAMPDTRACRFCDYNLVCGPYEELRTSRKPTQRIESLQRLRDIP
jgi:ATP-dependent helicase/nuclease subunit B